MVISSLTLGNIDTKVNATIRWKLFKDYDFVQDSPWS